MEQCKRENNLRDDVIVIQDSDDEVTFLSGKVFLFWEEENNNDGTISTGAIDEIVDDDVPKERVKRTNIPRVKITGKRRLYRLIDKDEDHEDIYGHV
ncbi:hypothetical protein CTI12_AA058220 [Artemisia annua]|uniref:Uncharacterized protein n=1 Tax=Artemisia annua TaxID=35608 RepID=A0A2U1Q9M7_ARTAN|nr:hypothetical protein CTI12_AA058220 [Artemisia annua]